MPTGNKILTTIGLTCGSFDLLHAGHALMLEECKKHCDILLVGLHSDPTIDRPEKNKPVMALEERFILLKANKFVNDIWIYDTEEDLYGILEGFIEAASKGDTVELVRFLGADWKNKEFTGHDLPIRIHFTQRDHGFSSSELRNRVYEAELQKRP